MDLIYKILNYLPYSALNYQAKCILNFSIQLSIARKKADIFDSHNKSTCFMSQQLDLVYFSYICCLDLTYIIIGQNTLLFFYVTQALGSSNRRYLSYCLQAYDFKGNSLLDIIINRNFTEVNHQLRLLRLGPFLFTTSNSKHFDDVWYYDEQQLKVFRILKLSGSNSKLDSVTDMCLLKYEKAEKFIEIQIACVQGELGLQVITITLNINKPQIEIVKVLITASYLQPVGRLINLAELNCKAFIIISFFNRISSFDLLNRKALQDYFVSKECLIIRLLQLDYLSFCSIDSKFSLYVFYVNCQSPIKVVSLSVYANPELNLTVNANFWSIISRNKFLVITSNYLIMSDDGCEFDFELADDNYPSLNMMHCTK